MADGPRRQRADSRHTHAMRITLLGAAGGEVTGSAYLVETQTANVLLDCADGSVAEVAITGCTIQHTKNAPDSANIRILGRGSMNRRGQRMEFNCGNVTIGDNVLSDVQNNIHLVGVRGVTITGNTFWQGYAHNLLVEDSTSVVVGPMAVVFLQTLLRLLQRELSSIDRSSWTFWRGFGNPGGGSPATSPAVGGALTSEASSDNPAAESAAKPPASGNGSANSGGPRPNQPAKQSKKRRK